MSTRNAKQKIQRSKNFAQGYTMTNLLKSEVHIDDTVALLLDWMDRHASERQAMDIGKFFSFTASDIVGEVIFSKSFGFIAKGQDIGNAIAVTRPANAFANVMGFSSIIRFLLANPIVTWLGVLPLGHVFHTAMDAVAERQKNPDARFDIGAHWLRMHEKYPERLSLRDILAQVTISVGAGSDTISGGCLASSSS